MMSHIAVWLAVRSRAGLGLEPPTPTPSGTGFDWSRVHPDGSQIPKFDLFYKIMNAVLFLGGVAAFCGLVGGGIAFVLGPIFGAHIVSDRGKSMMWKASLAAIIVGSATVIIAKLLVL
jgi:hypothetical protein